MTVVKVFKKALWLKELVCIFRIIQDSVQNYCDSQSVIHLAKDYMYHKQTKHINVMYHMIRQWVIVKKVIGLIKICTKKSNGYDDKDHPDEKV